MILVTKPLFSNLVIFSDTVFWELSILLAISPTVGAEDSLSTSSINSSHAKPNVMSEQDQQLIVNIREAFESKRSIACTGCRYCMPCPNGVSIPEVFKLYNSYQLVKPHPIDKVVYQRTFLPAGFGADQCVSCGLCAEHCPQGLKIPELLPKVHAELVENWQQYGQEIMKE